MTTIIYQQDLDFLEEAKRSFEKHPRYETHRNTEDTHIALRYGVDRDCIMIYKLGEEVMFANNIMGVAPELVVKGEISKEAELKIKSYFEEKREHSKTAVYTVGEHKALGEMIGIRKTLDCLDIKIEGVNC